MQNNITLEEVYELIKIIIENHNEEDAIELIEYIIEYENINCTLIELKDRLNCYTQANLSQLPKITFQDIVRKMPRPWGTAPFVD